MKTLIAITLLACTSCGIIKFQSYSDYDYKYIELPSNSIHVGHSNELFDPCDTVREFPSRRTFVVIAMKLRKDSTWVYCPSLKHLK